MVRAGGLQFFAIVRFTVAWLVADPFNRSEAKGDLIKIQTLLLFKCKLFSILIMLTIYKSNLRLISPILLITWPWLLEGWIMLSTG